MHPKRLGKYGEWLARTRLVQEGFTVLCGNYHCRHGEIDLVARRKQLLVFVEVKTRRSKKYGEPEEALHYRKQQAFEKAVSHFLQNEPLKRQPKEIRLDLITNLWHPSQKAWQTAWYQNITM